MKGRKISPGGQNFQARENQQELWLILAKISKTRWTIYRAYILFINDTKLIKWGFDIEQFKNTVPKYPKKLSGLLHRHLCSSKFMFFLREGNVDERSNRSLSISRPLNSTHLDKRHNYRNSVFIRMLEIVIDKDFEYETVREKCINYLQKLT
jgi:hypothetical protein